VCHVLVLHLFNSLFSRTTWVSRYQKGKTSLDLNKTSKVLWCSVISWTTCKQSAPRCRQITTPTPHHSVFYRPDALPDAQPTVSKHWRLVPLVWHVRIKKWHSTLCYIDFFSNSTTDNILYGVVSVKCGHFYLHVFGSFTTDAVCTENALHISLSLTILTV